MKRFFIRYFMGTAALSAAPARIGNALLRTAGAFTLPLLLLGGVLLGLSGTVPSSLTSGSLPYFMLCALVVQVGIGLGNRKDFMTILRTFNMRSVLLPLFTIVGTLLFVLPVSVLLPHLSPADTLAVGSGFGYYSLSSMLILEMKSASIGHDAAVMLAAMSLLANVIRELFALLCCDAIARRGKVFAAISVAGINSMDVCLPLIFKGNRNQSLMPAAIIHGIVLEVSVPLLLGLLC